MPKLHRYVSRDNPGWYVKLTLTEVVNFGLSTEKGAARNLSYATHHVTPDGNAFLDAMDYKDDDAIDRSLYWLLYRRGIVYSGTTPPSRSTIVGSDEWAEICRMVAEKTHKTPISDVARWLRLTPREVELLRHRQPAAATKPDGQPARQSEEPWMNDLTPFGHLSKLEFRQKYNLGRSETDRLYREYCAACSRGLDEGFTRGALRIVLSGQQQEAGGNSLKGDNDSTGAKQLKYASIEEVSSGKRSPIPVDIAVRLLLVRIRVLEGQMADLARRR